MNDAAFIQAVPRRSRAQISSLVAPGLCCPSHECSHFFSTPCRFSASMARKRNMSEALPDTHA